jgi:hypothetical protein
MSLVPKKLNPSKAIDRASADSGSGTVWVPSGLESSFGFAFAHDKLTLVGYDEAVQSHIFPCPLLKPIEENGRC